MPALLGRHSVADPPVGHHLARSNQLGEPLDVPLGIRLREILEHHVVRIFVVPHQLRVEILADVTGLSRSDEERPERVGAVKSGDRAVLVLTEGVANLLKSMNLIDADLGRLHVIRNVGRHSDELVVALEIDREVAHPLRRALAVDDEVLRLGRGPCRLGGRSSDADARQSVQSVFGTSFPPQSNSEASNRRAPFKPLISSVFSKEAVGIDVDADADFGAPFEAASQSRMTSWTSRLRGRERGGAGGGGRGAWPAGRGRGRTPPFLRLAGAAGRFGARRSRPGSPRPRRRSRRAPEWRHRRVASRLGFGG